MLLEHAPAAGDAMRWPRGAEHAGVTRLGGKGEGEGESQGEGRGEGEGYLQGGRVAISDLSVDGAGQEGVESLRKEIEMLRAREDMYKAQVIHTHTLTRTHTHTRGDV